MNFIKSTLLLSLLIILPGCVHLTPIENSNVIPNDKYGYIVGSFTRIDSAGFAFALRNTHTGTEYVMPFGKNKVSLFTTSTKQEVVVIKVEPGNYVLTHWLVYDTLGKEQKLKREISDTFSSMPFDVSPDSAVFLGEYMAATVLKYPNVEWTIRPRRITSYEARDAFLRAYPNFGKNAFACRRCTDTVPGLLKQINFPQLLIDRPKTGG